MTERLPDHLQHFRDFWADLVMRDGEISMDLVARELYDYALVMDITSTVYHHVTDGRTSDIRIVPDQVITMADEVIAREVDSAVQDALGEVFDILNDGRGSAATVLERARCHVLSELARINGA